MNYFNRKAGALSKSKSKRIKLSNLAEKGKFPLKE